MATCPLPWLSFRAVVSSRSSASLPTLGASALWRLSLASPVLHEQKQCRSVWAYWQRDYALALYLDFRSGETRPVINVRSCDGMKGLARKCHPSLRTSIPSLYPDISNTLMFGR